MQGGTKEMLVATSNIIKEQEEENNKNHQSDETETE